MNRVVTLFMCIFLLTVLRAETLTESTACNKALQWFRSSGMHSKGFLAKDLQRKTLPLRVENMYLYSDADEGAFVLIGGSEEQPQVLGYGDKASAELPSNLQCFVCTLSEAQERMEQMSPVLNNYKIYKHDSRRVVQPLISALRNQVTPFNNSCPLYDQKTRCVVGCVATALEQIVSYHRYPSVLQDSLLGWTTDHYKVDTILPGTPIDFDHILSDYTKGYTQQEAKAVADLCYYCGIASLMEYGTSASGASLSDMIPAMKRAFGYKYAKYVGSWEYSNENWNNMLVTELENNRPVLYAGYNAAIGGHAFVLDGVNSEGLYHVLWGDLDHYNGYFDLSVLNTCEGQRATTLDGRLQGYYCNQEAVLLSPDSVENTIDTLVTAQRLRVDSIVFDREPDLCRYVGAHLYVRNVSDDDVAATFLLSTYSPTDTTCYDTREDIALAGEILKGHSSVCIPTYCWFHKYGKRVLTVFTDDSSFVIRDTIQVKRSYTPTPSVTFTGNSVTDSSVVVNMQLQNPSSSYWAGNLLTFELFKGEDKDDTWGTQHFTVLNIPPNESCKDSVKFDYLEPNTTYTLLVLSNWAEIGRTTFTSLPTGIQLPTATSGPKQYYNLQGIRLPGKPEQGIYIETDGKQSKKVIK